jgi:predicted CXXCH cytochrome family protein
MQPAGLMIFIRAIVLLAALTLAACDNNPEVDSEATSSTKSDGFAGTESCTGCHSQETNLWRNSHHDLAMQVATIETALGDFSGSQFEHNNVTSRFFTTDEALFVETDGSSGQLETFPIRYTFGVYPLQQYLVELPNGKIQALGIAWDSRPAEEGGQQWFHVYGDDFIDHTDVLHWTQPSQNWETMCADCHSTNLISNYSVPEDHFETSWSELNVACEACHGPGAKHVDWANNKSDDEDNGLELHFAERQNMGWILDATTGNSQRSTPRTSDIEINACAACHSRRARVANDTHPATPFLDTYTPALIEQPLYHQDGQILDEVYVYGSFMQSRMQQAGVTCSDCHDPHSLQLRAPGPAVCLQCHASDTFATAEHQLHEEGVANCIDCHMPATTYMQVDPRNDHSFRIPRPHLSEAYGVPNACTGCHTDQDASWATQVLQQKGRSGADKIHWSELLASANQVDQASMEALTKLAVDPAVPVIIRASAVSRLRFGDGPAAQQLAYGLAHDTDALIRLGVARALQDSHPALTAQIGPELLNDPIRSVRIAAARALAGIDPVFLPAGTYADLKNGFAEYIDAQMVQSERAESHINVANLQRLEGHLELAEQGYLTAITLNPSFVPAYVNLADLYREQQQEDRAEATLRIGLEVIPDQADLHHALGLSLIRQQRIEEAIPELQLAAESPDGTARFALVYAIALNSQGKTTEAIKVLETALRRFTNDPELINAFSEFSSQLK